MSKTKEAKELQCMEIKSCHNCKKWNNCTERGRGVCGDWRKGMTKAEYDEFKKARRKAKLKDGAKTFVDSVGILLILFGWMFFI